MTLQKFPIKMDGEIIQTSITLKAIATIIDRIYDNGYNFDM